MGKKDIPTNPRYLQQAVNAIYGSQIRANQLPTLDEDGNFTGEFYDRRLGAPEGQPDPNRLTLHLQHWEQKYGQKYQPVFGQQVEEFDHIDPYESEGLFDSISNMLASGYGQSLTGLVERTVDEDDEANLFGLIDSERLKRWQPNTVEQVGSAISSFMMPLDVAALYAGGGLGGAAARGITQKIAQKAIVSGMTLGSYEGARGFFEGVVDNEKTPLEGFAEGFKRGGILGLAFGGVGGAIPAKIAGSAIAAGTARTGAEIFTLGTLSPFMEGRTPTKEDFINAAGFIVGMKSVGLIASMPKRVFERKRLGEAKKLEELAEKLGSAEAALDAEAEAFIRENPSLYSHKFLRKAQRAVEGEEVGTVRDFVIGKRLREFYNEEVLDSPIRVSSEVPEGKSAAGWVDPVRKIAYINPKHPEKTVLTLFHEFAHLNRISKGRPVVVDGKEVPVAERSAESMAKFMAGLKKRGSQATWVKELRDKNVTKAKLGEVGDGAAEAINSIVKGADKKNFVFVTEAAARTTGRYGKQLYGSKRMGATIEDGKTWTIHDLSAPLGKHRDLLDRILAEADKNVYFSRRMESTPLFQQLRAEGRVKKVGRRWRLLEKSGIPEVPRGGTRGVTARKQAKTVGASEVLIPAAPKVEPSAEGFGTGTTGKAPKSPRGGKGAAEVLIPTAPTKPLEGFGVGTTGKAPKNPKSGKGAAGELGIAYRLVGEAFGQKGLDAVKRTADALKPRFMFQAYNRLKSETGRQITSGIDKVYKVWHRRLGTYAERLRQAGLIHRGKLDKLVTGRKGMSDEEAHALGDRLNKGQAPEYARILEDYHNEIAPIWKAAGLKLGKIEKYFPRMLKLDIRDKIYGDLKSLEATLRDAKNASDEVVRKILLTKGSAETTKALEYIVETKQARTLAEAVRMLNQRVNYEKFPTAPFERQRKLDLPSTYFETDARIVLPTYLNAMSKRAAELQVWGNAGKKVQNQINKLRGENPDEATVADKLIKIFTGQYEKEHSPSGRLEKVVDGWTAFQFGTKIALGRATLLNVTQPIISFGMEMGAFPTVKAGLRVLTDPSYRSYLRESGAVDRYLLEAAIGYRPSGKMGAISDRLGALSGFTGINKVLQYWSAATLDVVLKDWHRLARGTGPRAEWAQKRMKDVGVSWEKPLKDQGDLILEAMYRFATDSQLQANILRDPLFMNNPKLRPFLLFKKFGVRQASYIAEVVTREAKRGNLMPIVRLAVGGFLGGEAVIWALNKIKGVMSGEPQYRTDDDIFERVAKNIGIIGSFGMFSDAFEIEQASQLGGKVRFAVTPVPFADAEKLLDTWTNFIRDWESYGDGWLATKRNAYNLFGFLGSYPRYLSERTRTDSQRSNRRKYLKGQERRAIFELWLDGNHSAMSERKRKWDAAYPDNQLNMEDVGWEALREYVKTRARKYAAASAERGTPEYREALRERRKELGEKMRGNR